MVVDVGGQSGGVNRWLGRMHTARVQNAYQPYAGINRVHALCPQLDATDLLRSSMIPRRRVRSTAEGESVWSTDDPRLSGCDSKLSGCGCVAAMRQVRTRTLVPGRLHVVWLMNHSMYYLTEDDYQRFEPGDELFVVAHLFDGEAGEMGGGEFRWRRMGDRSIEMSPVNDVCGSVYRHPDITPMLRSGVFSWEQRAQGRRLWAYGLIQKRIGDTHIVRFVVSTRELPVAPPPPTMAPADSASEVEGCGSLVLPMPHHLPPPPSVVCESEDPVTEPTILRFRPPTPAPSLKPADRVVDDDLKDEADKLDDAAHLCLNGIEEADPKRVANIFRLAVGALHRRMPKAGISAVVLAVRRAWPMALTIREMSVMAAHEAQPRLEGWEDAIAAAPTWTRANSVENLVMMACCCLSTCGALLFAFALPERHRSTSTTILFSAVCIASAIRLVRSWYLTYRRLRLRRQALADITGQMGIAGQIHDVLGLPAPRAVI